MMLQRDVGGSFPGYYNCRPGRRRHGTASARRRWPGSQKCLQCSDSMCMYIEETKDIEMSHLMSIPQLVLQ